MGQDSAGLTEYMGWAPQKSRGAEPLDMTGQDRTHHMKISTEQAGARPGTKKTTGKTNAEQGHTDQTQDKNQVPGTMDQGTEGQTPDIYGAEETETD